MADELGSIHEINSSITHHQQLLATSSRSRLLSVPHLGLIRIKRYKLSDQREDLDKPLFILPKQYYSNPIHG
ncbi:hypothetical protein EDB83DRAFT_2525531 [Lactarius deliciosus]|nr:hypothetical protein EDB83DRAFT_2525531 [Lactarius deliciosus]